MADYSPNWSTIAGTLIEAFKDVAGIGAIYSPYPENALDVLELPCLVINEPTDIEISPFTFNAFTVTYTGEMSYFVKAVDTGQARLYTQDINEITAAALVLSVAVHQKRFIRGAITHIRLGAGKMARLSPYDDDTRGHYAVVNFQYTVQMQYRSGA